MAGSIGSVVQQTALGMQDPAEAGRFYDTLEAAVSTELENEGKFKFVREDDMYRIARQR